MTLANRDAKYDSDNARACWYSDELTESSFAELKEHDPVLFDLLREIWGPD